MNDEEDDDEEKSQLECWSISSSYQLSIRKAVSEKHRMFGIESLSHRSDIDRFLFFNPIVAGPIEAILNIRGNTLVDDEYADDRHNDQYDRNPYRAIESSVRFRVLELVDLVRYRNAHTGSEVGEDRAC